MKSMTKNPRRYLACEDCAVADSAHAKPPSTANADLDRPRLREQPSLPAVSMRVTTSIFLYFALVLFLPAGDIRWWKGWLFVLVFLVLMIAQTCYLWFGNAAVLAARSKVWAGTKAWDKVLIRLVRLSLIAIFVVAALDCRYHWSVAPLYLIAPGYVLLVFGVAMSTWAQGVNKFAELGVRIQTERRQKVVDTGPYAFLRHPLYLGAFFLYGSIPLTLGSNWALIPAAVAALVCLVRTEWEDRSLRQELDLYKEYASRVRFRLIPGVW